jgi:hypothetical protein
MTSTSASDVDAQATADPRLRRRLSAAELAWIAAIPFALLVTASVLALGPPVGRWLFPRSSIRLWWPEIANPEPTEHARYLIGAGGPLLLSGAIVLLHHRGYRERVVLRAAAHLSELLLLAFVVFAVVAQHTFALEGRYADYPRRIYFTDATLAMAMVFAVLGVVLMRARFARDWAIVRETRARRYAALLAAVVFVAVWLLTAINTEGSLGAADPAASDNAPFWLDETFAILNGGVPLVSFHEQYAQLLPYGVAGIMALVGTTYLVYSTSLALMTGAVMLAVYATFRRVVRSSLLALALFLPFLATSFFKEEGTVENTYGPSNLLSLFPVRYGGAYLLLWLLARRLDGARPRRAWVLFFVAGLVAIDNLEFDLPALLATFAALVWTAPRPFWPYCRRLVAEALLGILAAIAAVSLLTLVASGSLPRFDLLFEFTRIYAMRGFGMLPMPPFGLHLALFVTFSAAIVVATTRALRRDDRLLTGLLCWAGVFGLGAGGYYVGRSHPEVLIDVFSAWAFAICLLLVAVVRDVAARPSRRPTLAGWAVFVAFGVAICSIAQTPAPWSQLGRLRTSTNPPLLSQAAAERFIRRTTRPGQTIGIIGPLGHRVAYDIGVEDVVPYAQIGSMPSIEQWDETMRLLRRRHVQKLFFYEPSPLGRLVDYLIRAGWTPMTLSASSHDMLLVRRVTLSGG